MSNYINISNEEIWEMLKPKLLENYIFPNNVSEAVGMAYKIGYERAIQGRPFKFGEKKKKGGHWEPVDPNNLPKEGTKVRYARESKEYSQEPGMITLGDIGEFSRSKTFDGWVGIYFHDGRYWDWVSFTDELYCLDMWVEDNE